jgi:thiamine biosynthesis lipoprotein
MVREYRRTARHMGSVFEFAVVCAGGPAEGESLLDLCTAEVRRIEALLTEFEPHSDTYRINQYAGNEPVRVSEETFSLLQRCLDISRLTGGTFDISAGALKKLYRFDNTPAAFPPPKEIDAALKHCGYDKIRLLPNHEVLLHDPEMRINFAAIGKGYASDRVRTLLKAVNVAGAAVNASGDLSVWGARADGAPWKIGVAHPDQPDRIMMWLPAEKGLCLATSGNYEQYFEHLGVRYGHTIDPRSGRPVTGIKSVTVISPRAELSDALATAVTVMGTEKGLEFIGRLPETHCIIVDEKNRIHTSPNLEYHGK